MARIRLVQPLFGAILALLLLVTGAPALARGGARQPEPEPRTPFVFVSLPDTQVYAEDRFPDGRIPAVTDIRGTGAIFYDQTRWIVENAGPLGIRYVGHLGDIVQDGNDLTEWALAEDAMHLLLEADIPHGTVMGNHDDTSHPPTYQENYLAYFGPQVFEGRPWFTASSPNGAANFQLLEHEGYKIGFLNLSIDHPQADIDWAEEIVTAHPDTIFVIGTHRYLYDFKLAGGRYGEDVPTILGNIRLDDGPVPGAIDPVDAETLYQEFVSQHPNVLMIHAGHFHAEWLRLDGTNGASQQIYQILTDYQSTRNGGDGWLRLYEFDFDRGTLAFDTWSPTLNRPRTTIDHFVETIALAYHQRGQIRDVLDVTDAQYFLLLEVGFKDDPNIEDGFLLQHPDLDEPEEQAYYQQYLEDLFLGSPPEGFDDILAFERLWMIGFAADPDDPYNFDPSVRSPSLTLDVDFSAYFTPSIDQLLTFAFRDLKDGIAGLSQDQVTVHAAALRMHRVAKRVEWLAERGQDEWAARVLEHRLLERVDGCALRGEPDTLTRPRPPTNPWERILWFWRNFWALLLEWITVDWVSDCDAQGEVYPHAVEILDLLAERR